MDVHSRLSFYRVMLSKIRGEVLAAHIFSMESEPDREEKRLFFFRLGTVILAEKWQLKQ